MPGDGPIPKRSDQRRRRNKNPAGAITKAPSGSSEIPEVPPTTLTADPAWHSIAADWFNSLAASGQSQFYEASDWATARYVAEAMSRNLSSGERFSAVLFASVMSGMTELLTTEGSRRRARLELEREKQPEPASVHLMEKYRNAASKGS
jgi:hypothetical protein